MECIVEKKKCSSKNLWELKTVTFRFNNKPSLFNLLCTLARLCKGTPLQLLRIDFFVINFPWHPRSQLPFLTFRGQDNRTRGKACRSHDRAPLPNLPAPDTSRPTPYPNYPPPKVSKHHTRAAPFCVAALCLRKFFLALRETFSLCTHLVLSFAISVT